MEKEKEVGKEKTFVTITIVKGDEYRSKINNIYLKTDIFYGSYRSAASNLEEILWASEEFCKKEQNNDFRPMIAGNNLLGYTNNIIAFCADRGHGKTSAMVSFSKALAEMQEPLERNDEDEISREEFWNNAAIGGMGGNDRVRKTTFKVLKYVDPTMIEESDSILRVLLVRLFNDFEQWWEKECVGRWTNTQNEEQTYNELVDLFQKSLHTVKLLLSEKVFDDNGDELDQIIDQGDVSNLRGLLYSLISKYLNLVTKNDQSVLVIQIDDADLNTEKAYRIMEDIRRYLFMPRVVVLMAMNVNQMESIVEQHFLQEFSVSLRNKGMIDTAACHNMAERYLDKTLPGSRQLYLKNVDDLLRDGYSRLRLRYEDHTTGKNMPVGGLSENMFYQEQLLGLLYEKTGMVFLVPDFLHNLLPHTMRELTHFLAFFQSMEDIKIEGYLDMIREDAKIKRQKWLNNVQWLEHYMLNMWAPLNLREEEKRFLQKLNDEGDANKNLQVLKFLPEYYGHRMADGSMARGVAILEASDYRNRYMKRCRERGIYIDDISNRQWATYANVCEALNLLSEMPGGSACYKFIYAIHLCYSIRLHKLMLQDTDLESRWKSIEVILGNTLFNLERIPIETEWGTMKGQHMPIVGLSKNIPSKNALSVWCKRVVPQNGELGKCVYESLNESDLEDDTAQIVFDPFYSLQNYFIPNAMGILSPPSGTSSQKDTKELKGETEDTQAEVTGTQQTAADIQDGTEGVQQKAADAKSEFERAQKKAANMLFILLNWDVQYLIQRKLKQKKHKDLEEWIEQSNETLKKEFKKIEHIPGFTKRDIIVFEDINENDIGKNIEYLSNLKGTILQLRRTLTDALEKGSLPEKGKYIGRKIDLFEKVGLPVNQKTPFAVAEKLEMDKVNEWFGKSEDNAILESIHAWWNEQIASEESEAYAPQAASPDALPDDPSPDTPPDDSNKTTQGSSVNN